MAPKKRREQRQQKKQIQQSTDSDSDDESPLSSSRRRITPSISRSSINRTENDKRSTSKKSSRWTKIFLLLDVFAIVLVYLFTHAHYHHLYHHHGGHMQAEIASYAHPEKESTFRFAIVADRDHSARHASKFQWSSHIRFGSIERHGDGTYSVEVDQIDDAIHFHTSVSRKNRSMELSDLAYWNGHLYSACDYTGFVYELNLDNEAAIPRFHILDGPGDGLESIKPFKSEWMLVRNGQLVIGSIGKEWVENGKALHFHPNYVKFIPPQGAPVHSEDWTIIFESMRAATNTSFPGYMVHEAAAWHDARRQWVFIPRRASSEMYDEVKDELMGTNLVILLDDPNGIPVSSPPVKVFRVGERRGEWGYSSAKVIPGTDDVLAVRVREVDGEVSSAISVFSMSPGKEGQFLLRKDNLNNSIDLEAPFYCLGKEKYEGVEFVPYSLQRRN